MNVTGIIAEYDPFHNGHEYHLEEAKKITGADAVIAVISGNFTQRGLPAFFGKSARARAALLGGADLVLELPYIYSCNAGREFARGGVEILESLGVVTDLVFGSECGDLKLLKRIADLDRKGSSGAEENERVQREVKRLMDGGSSYPTAFSLAVLNICGDAYSQVLDHPNNVLGIEYIRALNAVNSKIRPHCIERTGSGHTETEISEKVFPDERRTASGTALRNKIKSDGVEAVRSFVPASVFRVFRQEAFFDSMDKMYQLLRYRLITADAGRLREIYTVTEGIENRLKGAALQAEDFGGFMDLVRTKRYTDARIRRMLIHILTDFTGRDYEALRGTAYARVLGFSGEGARLLRKIRRNETAEVISNLSGLDALREKTAETLRWEMKACDLISLMSDKPLKQSSERRYVPVRV